MDKKQENTAELTGAASPPPPPPPPPPDRIWSTGIHWPKYRVIEDQIQHLFYIEKRVYFFFWNKVLKTDGRLVAFYTLNDAQRYIAREKENAKPTGRRVVFED